MQAVRGLHKRKCFHSDQESLIIYSETNTTSDEIVFKQTIKLQIDFSNL